jgi:hypothetical protein
MIMQADPEYLEVFATMNLRKLDLYLHLPKTACDYSAELESDPMGTIPPPPLDEESSKIAAVKLMETISRAQMRPLEWLTLHIVRTGYHDRFQPYMMFAKIQLRRREANSTIGDGIYEYRGRHRWGAKEEFNEYLLLEE